MSLTRNSAAPAAKIPVNADGLYAVSAPEDWDPTEYLAQDAGEFEDLDEGAAADVDDFQDTADSGDFEDLV